MEEHPHQGNPNRFKKSQMSSNKQRKNKFYLVRKKISSFKL